MTLWPTSTCWNCGQRSRWVNRCPRCGVVLTTLDMSLEREPLAGTREQSTRVDKGGSDE